MELVNLYKCLCDMQRLRILNLLRPGPLCVCHLQELLPESQVKVSKQLAYMKKLGMVAAQREGAWMIYRLPQPLPPLLLENLQCLQDCASEYPVFGEDLQRRATVMERMRQQAAACPEVVIHGNASCCA
ncbi:MAG: ArsR/SmtB family transcription factor [Verrucomicrobiota bacterium]